MLSRIRIGETILGILVLSLGAFLAIQTWTAPSIAARSVVGPGIFPGLVAAGLFLVGMRLLYEAFALRFVPEDLPHLDWRAMGILAAGFLLMIFILEPFGWMIAGTMMFSTGAYAFGSRRWLRNFVVGALLTTLTFFVFDYGLDLSLPIGTLVEDAIIALGGDI